MNFISDELGRPGKLGPHTRALRPAPALRPATGLPPARAPDLGTPLVSEGDRGGKEGDGDSSPPAAAPAKLPYQRVHLNLAHLGVPSIAMIMAAR
jgi:hypothetical protein